MLAKLYALLLHPIAGVPAWFPTLVVLGAVASQAVKVAKWTSAQRLVELAARGALKIPLVGAYVALIPLLGDILRYIANDDENLPPTLTMRIRGSVPPKAPPSPPTTPAIIAFALLGFFACAHLKAAVIDFGKCELGQVPSDVTSLIPDVTKAIDGEAWQSDLANLGKKAGIDAIGCAIAAILHQIPIGTADLSVTAKVRIARGKTWLAAHGHAGK